MVCPDCGLPDAYRGQGDGIGSCDCPRCDCCGAGPQECRCGYDADDFQGFYDDEMPYDYLCNDPGCLRRDYRLALKEATPPPPRRPTVTDPGTTETGLHPLVQAVLDVTPLWDGKGFTGVEPGRIPQWGAPEPTARRQAAAVLREHAEWLAMLLGAKASAAIATRQRADEIDPKEVGSQ